MMLLEEIKTKLRVENCKNLSDEELKRCLIDCVAGHRLFKLAKKYRNKGFLDKVIRKCLECSYVHWPNEEPCISCKSTYK